MEQSEYMIKSLSNDVGEMRAELHALSYANVVLRTENDNLKQKIEELEHEIESAKEK